jgi:hypothetical protein
MDRGRRRLRSCFGGCDEAREYLSRDPGAPPAAAEVAPYYAGHGGLLGVEVKGNVVELRVNQPFQQIDRGGSLWARVGPYVYPHDAGHPAGLRGLPGVAAVRGHRLPDGSEVARAMLRRDALNEMRWRRTLNILGHALQDGQENPRRLEELTDWGEAYTEFRYNPAT